MITWLLPLLAPQAKGEEFADKYREWSKLKERVAERIGVSIYRAPCYKIIATH